MSGMFSPDGQDGPREALILAIVGLLATAVRLAADPPASIARTVWLTVGGLGLATGGWIIARAIGLNGWSAMATAWVFGVLGSEAMLPIIRRWLHNKINRPPG